MMGGAGFPGQDPTIAALAAMSGQNSSSIGSSAPKKEHPRSSSDSSQRGRKSKKVFCIRSQSSSNQSCSGIRKSNLNFHQQTADIKLQSIH